jgi:hypothetical protein
MDLNKTVTTPNYKNTIGREDGLFLAMRPGVGVVCLSATSGTVREVATIPIPVNDHEWALTKISGRPFPEEASGVSAAG